MKVSVIIPTYNRSSVLSRAIDSVLRQSFRDFELIVVDDGSTDNTKNLIEQYSDQITYIYQDNKGVSAARNLGLKHATGEWVAFLDSDDEWKKKKLEKQIAFIEKNPLFQWSHGNEKWLRNGKHLNQKKIHQKSGGDIFERSLHLCLISPSTVIIKRDLLQRMNGFDPEFIVCEDYDLWLRILKDFPIGFIEDELIIKHGGHDDQLSHKYKAMDYYRVKSIDQLLPKLSDDQKESARHVLLKKCEILINGYRKHQNYKDLKEIEEIYSRCL